MKNNPIYDGLVLFSGGLDSILAVKLLEEQGLKIKCLHFVSSFFGKPEKIAHWNKIYNLDIIAVDILDAFADIFKNTPEHGFGSVLNPCIDCKILMLKSSKKLMADYGAKFVATGEIVGQRPMSQRKDALNIIRRDADAKDILLRPLCAKYLEPTQVELSGLVDREKLLNISGRGRSKQMALAKHFNISEIPTPAGGCLLTETQSAKNFWPILKYTEPVAANFKLASAGRQFWYLTEDDQAYWLCVGRKQADNDVLFKLQRAGDILVKVRDFPGPLALIRPINAWTEDLLQDAASFVASFASKALSEGKGEAVAVRLWSAEKSPEVFKTELMVIPTKETKYSWQECNWEIAKEAIKERYKKELS